MIPMPGVLDHQLYGCSKVHPVYASPLRKMPLSLSTSLATLYFNSPDGGNFSLSINGGPSQIYDTFADSTECSSSTPQRVLAVNVKRSDVLTPRSDQNMCTGKNVGGEVQIDGVRKALMPTELFPRISSSVQGPSCSFLIFCFTEFPKPLVY